MSTPFNSTRARSLFLPAFFAIARISIISEKLDVALKYSSCSFVAGRCKSRKETSPPSNFLPSRLRPASIDLVRVLTPAMVPTPRARQAINMRKPLMPPRSSRNANFIASDS